MNANIARSSPNFSSLVIAFHFLPFQRNTQEDETLDPKCTRYFVGYNSVKRFLDLLERGNIRYHIDHIFECQFLDGPKLIKL